MIGWADGRDGELAAWMYSKEEHGVPHVVFYVVEKSVTIFFDQPEPKVHFNDGVRGRRLKLMVDWVRRNRTELLHRWAIKMEPEFTILAKREPLL